jgi:hypothetical protein
MPLPRPSGPRALWNDMRLFWAHRPRHQYVAAALAVLIPIGIVVVFYIDSNTRLTPVQTITFIDSWPASRSDAEIRAAQKARLDREQAARRERQRQFQKIDSQLNRLGI